ncbi:MAG: glutamate racemase [Chloroflexi bacterium]|nr:MAG: glutamate racemase [Chloroflexota bacterium]
MACIGVLDSGIGGLSVLREIHRLLPDYPTIYFADQKHLPYGPRHPDEIHNFVRAICEFLFDEGARVIVIACHTASAASLLRLRDAYPQIPFVGMEPAIKPAAERTRTQTIGVLMTQTTAEGALYRRVLARYAANVRVITQVAPELVIMAERGTQHTPEGRAILRRYLEPMLAAGVDHIALACTHFPFLSEALQSIVGDDVTLIDPSPAIAQQVRRIWPADVVPSDLPHRYFTSGDAQHFQMSIEKLLGYSMRVLNVSSVALDS